MIKILSNQVFRYPEAKFLLIVAYLMSL